MKKLLLASCCAAAIFMSGCESVADLMTYVSPSNKPIEETNSIFASLPVADNVFDDTVSVRGEISDTNNFGKGYKVYDFDTGRSVFRTYALPLNATNINIKIESQIGKTTFAPSVALLTKDKRLVRIIQFSSFEYRPLSDLTSDNLRLKFNLNNFSAGENAIAYMVIFTQDKDLQGTTKIVHPAKLYAMSHKSAVPEIEDPLIPHARLGRVDVYISMESSSADSISEFWDSLDGPLFGGSSHQYISDDDDGSVKSDNKGAVVTIGGKTQVVQAKNPEKADAEKAKAADAKKQPAAPKGSMLKETEDMYNDMIMKAANSGDIAKAMKLAEEAVNAGSSTADQTLAKALRKSK